MTTVRVTALDAAGAPVAGANVHATLIGTSSLPVVGYTATGVIVTRAHAETDDDGTADLDLIPTDDIDPGGTRYQVDVLVPGRMRARSVIEVPDDDDPVDLVDLLSDPPGALAAPGSIARSMFTARGDLARATGAGAVDRLALGEVGQVLTALEDDPAWQHMAWPLFTAGQFVEASSGEPFPEKDLTGLAYSGDHVEKAASTLTAPRTWPGVDFWLWCTATQAGTAHFRLDLGGVVYETDVTIAGPFGFARTRIAANAQLFPISPGLVGMWGPLYRDAPDDMDGRCVMLGVEASPLAA